MGGSTLPARVEPTVLPREVWSNGRFYDRGGMVGSLRRVFLHWNGV